MSRLNDRQRVELMLPPQVMLAVLLAGVDDPEHPDAKRCQELLLLASMEPIKDLTHDRQRQIANRVARDHAEATAPYRKEGGRVDKMGLIAYYWLKALLDQEYLVLGPESYFSQALDIMLPALEPAAQIENMDKSAQKQARKFLMGLQKMGYYRGVDPNLVGM